MIFPDVPPRSRTRGLRCTDTNHYHNLRKIELLQPPRQLPPCPRRPFTCMTPPCGNCSMLNAELSSQSARVLGVCCSRCFASLCSVLKSFFLPSHKCFLPRVYMTSGTLSPLRLVTVGKSTFSRIESLSYEECDWV